MNGEVPKLIDKPVVAQREVRKRWGSPHLRLDNIYQGGSHSPFSMSTNTFLENRRGFAVDRLFRWNEEAGLVSKLIACLLFAVLMALAAQVRIYLPFTPVPFTGQVLVVLLVGFVLGRFGTLSVGMYLGLGASFGWFSGQVGFAALSGVTAGYLFGFVIAAALIGEMAHRNRCWNLSKIALVMGAGAAVILVSGSIWLSFLLHLDLTQALLLGAMPFLAVDVMKVILASSAAYLITPHRTRPSQS
jgi:biotin transport system substrate-specific component